MNIEDHPTVKRMRATAGARIEIEEGGINADWLRRLTPECGGDDAGLVEIKRPALDSQRDELLHHYPWTKTLLSFVVRMNREPIRSPARSVANIEFHHSGLEVDEVGRRLVQRLEAKGIRAVSPAMAFRWRCTNSLAPYGSYPTSPSPSPPGSATWASIAI